MLPLLHLLRVKMDESQIIDWYEVVEAVSNGRMTGHRCPICHQGDLETAREGSKLRLRCPECGEGFEGNMGWGRDDGFYAEADALMRRQEERKRRGNQRELSATLEAPQDSIMQLVEPAPSPLENPPEPTLSPKKRPEPWSWQLSARAAEQDPGEWMPVVEAIYNGKRSGLNCPLCSEPLTAITVQEPYLRVHCLLCGEGFEGRLGW